MFASHAPRKGSQGKPKDGEPDERPGCVKVLFAYTPSYEGELELAVGDIIEVKKQNKFSYHFIVFTLFWGNFCVHTTGSS